jgi:hypothetical protein
MSHQSGYRRPRSGVHDWSLEGRRRPARRPPGKGQHAPETGDRLGPASNTSMAGAQASGGQPSRLTPGRSQSLDPKPSSHRDGVCEGPDQRALLRVRTLRMPRMDRRSQLDSGTSVFDQYPPVPGTMERKCQSLTLAHTLRPSSIVQTVWWLCTPPIRTLRLYGTRFTPSRGPVVNGRLTAIRGGARQSSYVRMTREAFRQGHRNDSCREEDGDESCGFGTT